MRCAVLNCTSKFKSRQKHSKQLSFFSFPKNPDVLKKWLAFCRKNNNDRKNVNHLKSVICNEHFNEEDIQGGLQFQMGLCSKRTLRPGAVPCINKNNISEAERERYEKRKNKKLVDELLKEAEAREAAEASGAITAVPDIIKNAGIASVPDFVSAPAFIPFPPTPSESDPLAEEQADANLCTTISKDKQGPDQIKCRTCCRYFVADENAKDLGDEQNAVMLYHIEVITGIWIQCKDKMSSLMCYNCVTDLKSAIEFREVCIRTELELANEETIQTSTELKDDTEICDTYTTAEAITTSDNVNESFLPIFLEEEPVAKRIHKKKPIKKVTNTDPKSLALGTQIYEDLLNEYKGKDKLTRPRQKRVRVPKPKVVRQRKRKPREPKPKRPKRTKEERNRIRREQIRAMPLNHVCDQCGASFRVKCNLKIHLLRHNGIKNYPCSECPKEFYDAYMRNIHVRVVHKGELPFACNYCSKAFSSSNTRYLHEKKVHEATPRIIRNINILNRRIDLRENDQQQHSQVKDGRHFCSYCNKSYATKYALNWHINLHTGATPFKCKLCDMSFRDPQSKTKHEMRHDSKRPFECDICLKGFFTRTKLKEHERIHTGERPYRCDVCDAYFRYKFNLYSHQFSKMHKENLQREQPIVILDHSN